MVQALTHVIFGPAGLIHARTGLNLVVPIFASP